MVLQIAQRSGATWEVLDNIHDHLEGLQNGADLGT